MKKFIKTHQLYLYFFLICAGALLSIYYQQLPNTTLQKNGILIVVTTSIIADTVKNIVGDCAQVKQLMGPGVDPHLYRARESDVRHLIKADIVFYNGLHLEGKMCTVFNALNRYVPTFAVADGIEKEHLSHTDFEDIYDPHIWFDVSLWIEVTEYIAKQIIALDSDHAAIYRYNADRYIQKLMDLDTYVYAAINSIPLDKRILITAHDAFGYFSKRYNIPVMSLQGLSTDSDISTHTIQKLADYIAYHKIPAIFVESSIPHRALIAVQNAVKARNWNVAIADELYSDALSDESLPAATYYDMILYNTNTIVAALTEH